ncbi:MAG: glycosyltransferase family 4 protein [Actinomycetota bacterium]
MTETRSLRVLGTPRIEAESPVVMVEPTPGQRGPQRTLLTLARYLAERRPLIVAVPEGFVSRGLRAQVAGAEVLPLPFHASRPRSWAKGSLRLLSRLAEGPRPALLHANGLSALNLAAPAARRLNVPVFVHFHASEIRPRSRGFVRLWERLGVRMSLFPVSDFGSGLLEGAGLRRLLRGVLPNPVEGTGAARSQPHQPFRVGFVGSKNPVKGLHYFVRVARSMQEEDVEWHLYGIDLEKRRTRYVETCIAEIEAAGLHGRIKWCGKVEDVAAAYASVDALLVPSQLESFSRVAVEGMASGLPVVAARVGAIPEVVLENVSGRLFDLDRPEEAAEQVRSIVRDPQLWTKLSSGAIEVARRFDIAEVGQLIERYYEEVLANGARLDRNTRPSTIS